MEIVEVSGDERRLLEPILEESFAGWYRQHAKRTLRGIEVVQAAVLEGRRVGLVMLSQLNADTGYVYYIAVLPGVRGQGVAGLLLDHSLEYFFQRGVREVYASVTSDHAEPIALFRSRGVSRDGFQGALWEVWVGECYESVSEDAGRLG